MEDESRQAKQATEFTKKENRAFQKSLPLDDGTDAANVAKGFIATRTNPIIEKVRPLQRRVEDKLVQRHLCARVIK